MRIPHPAALNHPSPSHSLSLLGFPPLLCKLTSPTPLSHTSRHAPHSLTHLGLHKCARTHECTGAAAPEPGVRLSPVPSGPPRISQQHESAGKEVRSPSLAGKTATTSRPPVSTNPLKPANHCFFLNHWRTTGHHGLSGPQHQVRGRSTQPARLYSQQLMCPIVPSGVDKRTSVHRCGALGMAIP